MRISRVFLLVLFMVLSASYVMSLYAQNRDGGVVVDYNKPNKYIVGGVKVEGTNYLSPEQIIQVSGLQKGLEVTVPGEQITSVSPISSKGFGYSAISRMYRCRWTPSVRAAIRHSSRFPLSSVRVYPNGHSAE